MSVVTRKRSENYAVIPNAVADDARLSFEARGVLVYLLAKPHDWKIRIGDLRKQGLGRDKAYRILDQLQKAGYIERVQRAGGSGRYGEVDYTVYDDPVPSCLPLPEKQETVSPLPEIQEAERPLPETPDTENPDTENQEALLSTDSDKIPISTKYPARSGFAALVSAWHPSRRPDDRAAAEALFLALPADVDRDNAVAMARLYQRIQGKRRSRADMTTYLRTRAWRDLVDAPVVDHDGNFVITPEREEWNPWVETIRAASGEAGVRRVTQQRRIVRRDRWPPAAVMQHAMSFGMEAAE